MKMWMSTKLCVGLLGSTTVSYTHLDVYKRQDTHIFDGIGNPLLQLIGLGIGLEIAGTAGVLLSLIHI